MNILNFDAPFLVNAFQRAGHHVVSAGLLPGSDLQVHFPLPAMEVWRKCTEAGFTPDAAFFCDSGNMPYFPGMEELPCPSIFYSIDTYCNTWHMSYAAGFDHVLVAQQGHVQLFSDSVVPASWMPLFAKQGQDMDKGLSRDIPVAFVGTLNPTNIPLRQPFLQAFKRLHPLIILKGAYVDIFNRAQIVLNQTAFSEVNFRCFEAMACGAALLMEHSSHGLTELFTPGEHMLPLYCRGEAAEAAEQARKALACPQILARTAARGRDVVHSQHLDTHRAMAVVALFESLISEGAARQRHADLLRRRILLSAAYGMLVIGLHDSKFAAHVEYFSKLAADLSVRK